MKTLISFILIIGVISAQEIEQSFLREPFDQVAKIGEHVTLPCRVVDKVGVLQWTKDDFGLGSDRELDGFKRYRMTGSDEEGDYTLDIDPISLEDDGKFQCQVGAAEGVAPIRSRYASLTVLVPAEPPVIFPQTLVYKTVEGSEVELRCEARGGKPVSEITWFDGKTNAVIRDRVTNSQEQMPDGKRFNAISVLKFSASLEHHDMNFTCQAQNSADRQPATTSIRLEVHYPPHVELKAAKKDRYSERLEQAKPEKPQINEDDSSEDNLKDHQMQIISLKEGDSVQFHCDAQANPAQMTYTWYLGGDRLPDNIGAQLTLESVDRRIHGQSVKCEATNSIGRSEATYLLDIAYSPVFVSQPDNIAGMPGESVTLTCKVDSNPPASYTWYHITSLDQLEDVTNAKTARHPLKAAETPMSKTLIGSSANLTLVVNKVTVGLYECAASSPGFTEIASRAAVFMKGPPQIVNHKLKLRRLYNMDNKDVMLTKLVSYAEEGDTGHMTCEALSIPEATSVEWTFDGELIDENDERFSSLETKTAEGVRSTLIIRNVQEKDFGPFVCSVSNKYGTDSALFTLKKQAPLPLAVIIAGVLGGVILTVAVIMTAVLCKKTNSSSRSKENGHKGQVDIKVNENAGTANDLYRTMKKQKGNSLESGKRDEINGKVNNNAKAKNGNGSPASSTTTSAEVVSNNSADLKVGASDSISEEDRWNGSEDSYKASINNNALATLGLLSGRSSAAHTIHHKKMSTPAITGLDYTTLGGANSGLDFTDGVNAPPAPSSNDSGLPTAFENYGAQTQYGQFYTDNLLYSSGGSYSTRNGTHMTMPRLGTSSTMNHINTSAGYGPLHVRASPTSPVASQISVKTPVTVQPPYQNYSFDYMPASAFAATSSPRPTPVSRPTGSYGQQGQGNYGHIDNYSVYVNNIQQRQQATTQAGSQTNGGILPVPVHTSKASSSASATSGPSSLATHV